MIDYAILKKLNTTNDRLRDIFTAELPANINDLPEDEKKKKEADVATRKRFEELIQKRLMEQINFNLTNYSIYSAVDLAWDSTPINKSSIPLMLYAQGKIDMGKCATSLTNAGYGKYVSKNDKGDVLNVDLPKFYEVNVNLIRSIITRRLAAQSNKFTNLFPYFRYESRDSSETGELRGEVMSQLAEIVVDDFDYRHHDVQVMREGFLYAHVVDFVRAAWECENQFRRKPVAAELQKSDEDDFEYEAKPVKEGIAFINPHPSRVFWDNAHPLSSINSDTGCEYLGFWDVARYRDVKLNTNYWNRDKVTFSTAIISLFSTYSTYFSQYYTNIKAPDCANSHGISSNTTDLSGANDRTNTVGIYAGTQEDSSVILTNIFQKLSPKEWGLGDYPYQVWVRFVVGGDNTILFAEIMPSTPAAVLSYNENDNRFLNVSMAHELMGLQDQMTNLLSYLLMCLQADNLKIVIVDTDVTTTDQIKAFREQLKGANAYTGTTVLEISRSKAQEMGFNVDNVIKMVETKSSALDVIFRAIAQLVQMVERLMALSPQEQGQPAPREISATETNLIAGTTESVYGFISDAIDEFRAAKKRILYESYMAKGCNDIKVPVVNRYPSDVVKKAGFDVFESLSEQPIDSMAPNTRRFTIIGTKNMLEHDYVFTTRDGAERPVNTQAANVLVQLLNVLQSPTILSALGKERLYMIVNEIFRKSGAGVDLNLQVQPGEENAIGPDQSQQMAQVISQLADEVKNNKQATIQIQQQLGSLIQALGAGQQQPPPQQQQPIAA